MSVCIRCERGCGISTANCTPGRCRKRSPNTWDPTSRANEANCRFTCKGPCASLSQKDGFMRGQIPSSEVAIPVGGHTLSGELVTVSNAVVLFAHGSGSSRHSPRNQYVARVLHEAGVATLLFDLLTAEEEELEAYSGHLRFDIPLLVGRLVKVTRWVAEQESTRNLNL